MKTYITILGSAFLLLISTACFEKSTYEPSAPIENIADFENYVQSLIENQEPPGLSVVVVKGDRVLYNRGFGFSDIPNQQKTDESSVYQWWSLTKPFTATAILQLEEQGKLSLDDPVVKHLPAFNIRKSTEASKFITIKQLLTHSAGLGDIGMKIIGMVHYDPDDHLNQTELALEQVARQKKLRAAPGTESAYSNLGYMILAAIIEQVSDQSYASYIEQNILIPLEMRKTGFTYSQDMTNHAAVGSHPKDLMSMVAFTMMDKQKAIREKEKGIYWFNNLYSDQQGSTGLIGSTEDLAHFLSMILNEGTWNDQRILSPKSVEKMLTANLPIGHSPVSGLVNPRFGLSWFIHEMDSVEAYSHGGAGAAYVAQMRLIPEKNLGVAVMANSTYLGKDMGGVLLDQLAGIEWD